MIESIISLAIISAVTPISGYYVLKKANISEILDVSGITISDNNGVIKEASLNHRKENKRFISYINSFEKVLYSKPHINKYMYEKNISSTKILLYNSSELKRYETKKSLTRGYYSFDKNEIKILDMNHIDDIYHELIHLSNSFENKSVKYCGFEQINKDEGFKIGEGLNEGFTELQNTLYFNKKSKAYKHLRIFASKLSEIIGLEKMETFFYNADLKSLTEEMKKYGVTDKEIKKFITNMDYCCYFYKKKRIDYIDNNQYKKSIEYIQKFLLKMYMNKYIFENDNPSEKQYQEIKDKGVSFLTNSMINSYRLNETAIKPLQDKRIIVMDNDKASKYVDSALENAINKK